ncbi:hypothetical protein AVEN_181538-1, partial [Araneus ventricosus]
MEDKSNANSSPSISDPNSAVTILQNFFGTETVDENVMHSFLVNDKKRDKMYLKA